jgi:gamma-glutamyl-gamma-aminobutyrate hydrolase PuuD
MKNLYITQPIYRDKNNSIYFKTEMNWIRYSKKLRFNLIQINSLNNLKYRKIDGIIFSGGNNLSKIENSDVNVLRDRLENKIVKFAKEKKIPCLFVCRGMQFIANKEKIKIVKDRSKRHVGKNHKIIIGKKIITVNSYHNYCIKALNRKFIKIGYHFKDNSIEMMSHAKYNFLCTMFHPERYSPDQKKVDKFIKDFFKI